MEQTDRKPYASPFLQELGALKDITEGGNQPSAENHNGRDSSAFVPGS